MKSYGKEKSVKYSPDSSKPVAAVDFNTIFWNSLAINKETKT